MGLREMKVDEIEKKLEELEHSVEELRKIIVLSRLKCLALDDNVESLESKIKA